MRPLTRLTFFLKAGTGAERQTAKEPVKNVGSNFMLNSKRLVVPEADPPLAENFPEKRLASPRPPAGRAGSGRANDFIS